MMGRGVVGVGIGICNVVLGGVVKDKLAGDGGLMRRVYRRWMWVFGGVGSGVRVGVSDGMGGGWNR